jgi:hypothetical protein
VSDSSSKETDTLVREEDSGGRTPTTESNELNPDPAEVARLLLLPLIVVLVLAI